jgi:hypothetical protein
VQIIEAAMEFASGEDMSAEMSVALRRRYGGFRTTFYISKLHIEGKVKLFSVHLSFLLQKLHQFISHTVSLWCCLEV